MQHVWLQTEGGRAVNITADIGQPRLSAAVIPVNTRLEQFVDQPVQVLDRGVPHHGGVLGQPPLRHVP